jgi:hypothetical protein
LRINRPLYRIPYLSVMAAVNAGICVGVLASAVDAASVDATTRLSTVDSDKATDAVIVETLSRAHAASRSLRAGVVDVASLLWTAAACDGHPNEQLRAMVHATMFYAADVAREVIGGLYGRLSLAGSGDHPLERALHDIHAISCRFEPLREIALGASRDSIGCNTDTPM